jgi:hypothetical protein
MLKVYGLPTVKAATELNVNNSSQAIVFLEPTGPYELGDPIQFQLGTMYPVYIRGQAQLMAHNGAAAADEFQKFLDNSGVVWNCWTGALAHLELARANALEARTSQGADAYAARARALVAYKDFLTLWKDADPDIPILIAAKAEYAKLQ